MQEDEKSIPAWVTDTSITPPYPIIRCPRCKVLFDDRTIHVCKQINDAAREGL